MRKILLAASIAATALGGGYAALTAVQQAQVRAAIEECAKTGEVLCADGACSQIGDCAR